MSYVVVEDVAASWERYERFAAALDGPAPAGLIVHAAGKTDEGFRIVEVWESEEAWRRFGEQLHDEPPHVLRTLLAEHVVYGGREAR